jgi:hypothetical protein
MPDWWERMHGPSRIADVLAERNTAIRERDEARRELKNLRALYAEVKHQRDCWMRNAKPSQEEF